MTSDPKLWPEGYEKIVLRSVDSTNAEAARQAAHLGRPTWIMAYDQTGARGRRGRPWHHPKGNFAATLVMRPGGVPGWAALRSFLAANALFETLALYAPRDALALKWPNDVLLNGGKIAGILLESAGNTGQVDWRAIGVGVNLRQAPRPEPDSPFEPVSLEAEIGARVSQDEFLTLLAGHYATEEMVLERLGFDPIRQDWLERAAKLGEEITARTGNKSVTGIFDTVDKDGHLVLITGTGPVKIPAADIYF